MTPRYINRTNESFTYHDAIDVLDPLDQFPAIIILSKDPMSC